MTAEFKLPFVSDVIPPNYAYSKHPNTMVYGYMYLMHKYKSRCYISGELYYIQSEKKLYYVIDQKKKLPIDIGNELVQCIRGNSPIIFISVNKVYSPSNSHQILLIYRPFKQVIELFEPDNNANSSLHSLEKQLKKLFEVTLQPILDIYTPTYVPPINTCPRHRVGLQELEFLSNYEEEKTGYCQIWCLFIMECILMNPEMNTEDIIDHCFQVADTNPDKLRKLIRGYVAVLNQAISRQAQFNIGTGEHFTNELDFLMGKTTVDSEDHKQRLVERSVKNADLFRTLRTSPTRQISKMERTSTKKLTTLEKNLGIIKKCSDETRKRLCKHFHLDGSCKNELLKFVIKKPIPVKTLKKLISDLPGSKRLDFTITPTTKPFFDLLFPLSDENLKTIYDFYKIKDPTFPTLILHLVKSGTSVEYLKENLERILFKPSADNPEHQKIIHLLDSNSKEGLEWLYKRHLIGKLNKNYLIYYYLHNGGTLAISNDMQDGTDTGFFGA